MSPFPRCVKHPFAVVLFVNAFAFALLLPTTLPAQVGNDNPTGPAGNSNGHVTTGGSYDPYTGNVSRTVTDIVVTGAVGQYGLSWSRTWNSRSGFGSWQHNYSWTIDPIDVYTGQPINRVVTFPDGRVVNYGSIVDGNGYYSSPPGVSERLKDGPAGSSLCFLILPDGGRVEFSIVSSIYYDWETQTTHYTYDFTAQALIDPHGLRTTLVYEADGTFKVTEPAGRWIKHSFIPAGGDWNEKVTASDGREINYTFQTQPVAPGAVPHRLLRSVLYYDGTSAVYTYQAPNVGDANGVPLLSTCDDPMYAGPMKKIAYAFATGNNPDGSPAVYGQTLSERHANGTAVSSLTINGNSRTETRGDGPTRTFNYTGGRLTTFTDFKNQSSSISYDPKGFVNVRVDQRQNQTDLINQPLTGKPTHIIHPLTPPDTVRATMQFEYGSLSCPDPNNRDGNSPYYLYRKTDERGHSTIYWRDGNKRVIRIDFPNGAFEAFTYNSYGQVLAHTKSSGGTAGHATRTFTYDARQRLATFVPPPTPGDANPQTHPTRYNYYESGPNLDRLDYMTNPRGFKTWFEYNLRGQVTKVRHEGNVFRQMGYNPDGTLAWTADENHPNASWNADERTRYTYDDYKRVLTVKNPMNETTTMSYALDWVNPLVHTTRSIKYVNSPLNKNIVFDYDENFRKIHQVAALNTADEAWTLFQYDEVGNLTSVQDPRGNATTFAYDNRNRRTSATNPAPFNTQITRWEYDSGSNLTKEIRPDQSFRRVEYDALSRVIHTYGFANEHTEYVRDLAGNVTQMIDAKGAVYGFSYDALNRKTSAGYPTDATGGSRTEVWSYTVGGVLDHYKNPADQYQRFHFDERNRLDHSWWDSGVGPDVVTEYDFANRVEEITTNGGETRVRFGYDKANRQVWEEQTLASYPTRRVETPRDADGNRLLLHVPGYFGIRYGYTERNQLAHIYGLNWEPWFNYSYDPAGNLTKRQDVFWGVNDSLNVPGEWYDPLNRPVMWENTQAGDVPYARSWYQYDTVGREVATWRDEQGGKGERFYYSTTDQLTNVRYNADQVWTGNPVNWDRWVDYGHTPDTLNRWYLNDNGNFAWVGINPLNQYTSIGGVALGYNGNFNLISYGGWTAIYNAQNQLTSASANGNSVSFTYDGVGRCVRRVVYPPGGGSRTTLIAYDGWKPTVEFDGAGNFQAWNIYSHGADEILWRHDASVGQHLRYHHDRHGNVTFVLDGSGNILEKYTYDAFGTPTVTNADGSGSRSWSNYGNRFMFTGREYFPELGIYDYRNRFYHPGLGRFLQTDPIRFAGGDANLFRYCSGDPVNRVDPTGLFWGLPAWAGGVVAGGGVGGLGGAVGGIVNQTLSWGSGNGFSWGTVGTWTINGAVGGAVVGGTLAAFFSVDPASLASHAALTSAVLGGATAGTMEHINPTTPQPPAAPSPDNTSPAPPPYLARPESEPLPTSHGRDANGALVGEDLGRETGGFSTGSFDAPSPFSPSSASFTNAEERNVFTFTVDLSQQGANAYNAAIDRSKKVPHPDDG
jgi:RHS repeat-associated protein